MKCDATLYAYYSWNNGTTTDDGPHGIDGNFFGSVSIENGKSDMGLMFSTTDVISYFAASGFTILGNTNQSFSTSIWVKPTSLGGTILFIALHTSGWGACYPILGMKATGEPAAVLYDDTQGTYAASSPNPLPLNEWSHLVQTFSTKNGRKCFFIFLAFDKWLIDLVPDKAIFLS